MYFIALGVFIIIVCLLLTGIVLIQNPKGGGVNATFGGVSNQILGAGRTTDIVEKWTWYFAAAFLILCLISIPLLPDSKLGSTEPQQSDAQVGREKGGLPTMSTPTSNTNGVNLPQGTPAPAGQPTTTATPQQQPTNTQPTNNGASEAKSTTTQKK